MSNSFTKNECQQALVEKIGRLADGFSERTARNDEEGLFPFENFEELKEADYLALTVPKEQGGQGANLYDFLLAQERLAQGDGATALSIGWHLGSILEIAENKSWDPTAFERLCKKVVQEKALINRAATEPATGSPTRGGMPQTTAVEDGSNWILNGRKSFTSMAVALDYSLVTARIGDTDKKGVFLADHNLDGVGVEATWNTISMRGTRSDDLVLNEVVLDEDAFVEEEGDQADYRFPKAWLLHIPACYLGIAIAARNYAVKFASEYKPNSLPGPIKEVPEVQRKIGEMELELFKARQVLYGVAAKWVEEPEKRAELGPELAAVKHIATNSANNIVDIAMRIVGARSLGKNNPLQQYYRDVRAGLHNPPMDDSVISMLAKRAIAEY
ncbi:acyl-CoA dehydrogenase family protein [Sediminibacillus massiliensis]|uniref:acyl-CoA dehydrogenase family protein n=1 Tax=Sediminibacillus massiliensis TaxID=1926277 RepID=UPI000BAE0CCB|nr:acyl-CoA dehydrogenase family protein [Sediminibacillus massiliensis]